MPSPETEMLTAMGRMLVDACASDNRLWTRELIAAGADVNQQAHDGTEYPPLHTACLGGHAGIAGLLLNAGANVNQNTQNASIRISPLFAACAKGHTLVVALLLRQESLDINQVANIRGTVCTPLHAACMQGHHEVVELLIQHAALDVNHVLVMEQELEEGGRSPTYVTLPPPLHTACMCGHHKVVELLLRRKDLDANLPHIRPATGLSLPPLIFAYKTGNPKVVELLLRHYRTAAWLSVSARKRKLLRRVMAIANKQGWRLDVDVDILGPPADEPQVPREGN